MNVQVALNLPRPVRFKVNDFLLLREADAFGDYSKTELLDGEVFGVLRQADDEPECDASLPILLQIQHYELLAANGAFDQYGRTELLDGVVYELSPQYRPHGFVKDELAYGLRRSLETLGSAIRVATEQSVAIPPVSEPEPDIILTTEPKGHGAIPVQTVELIVEVADSTRRYDLQLKATIYAEAGVGEYWVADVNERVVYQMWMPEGAVYTERREVVFGERVKAATIAGLSVATDTL